MTRRCNKCGSPIPDGINFCSKCGATTEQIIEKPFIENQEKKISHNNKKSQIQKPSFIKSNYGQKKPEIPKPDKSKKGIILVISILIIVIFASLIVFFFLSENDEDKLIGTWELESTKSNINGTISTNKGNGTIIVFKSDNTYKISFESYFIDGKYQPHTDKGTWKFEDGKLCFNTKSDDVATQFICYNYRFTNNDNKIILNEKYSSKDFSSEITMTYKKI